MGLSPFWVVSLASEENCLFDMNSVFHFVSQYNEDLLSIHIEQCTQRFKSQIHSPVL